VDVGQGIFGVTFWLGKELRHFRRGMFQPPLGSSTLFAISTSLGISGKKVCGIFYLITELSMLGDMVLGRTSNDGQTTFDALKFPTVALSM
jgi:hypothetical protein